MKHSYTVACMLLGAGILTACSSNGLSSSPTPIAAEGQPSRALLNASRSPLSQATETILHSFDGPTGVNPIAPLISVDGTLYGTTLGGGYKGNLCRPTIGCGVVFKYTGTGFSIVHLLDPAAGYAPRAGLTALGDLLFGVAADGGVGFGTVFKIAQSEYSVVHKFGSEGQYPVAGMVDVDGTLYGTTWYGGKYGGGTIFKIASAGTEPEVSVIHNFGQGSDGAHPFANLIYVNHALYGTTQEGGTRGVGVVFSISLDTEAESVIYPFEGGNDGARPHAGLIYLDGAFFGTTEDGGQGGECCGTVYRVTPTGKEHVLYRFQKLNGSVNADGAYPRSDLVNVTSFDGNVDKLYGTTATGGKLSFGTIFSIDPVGNVNYTVIHTFAGAPNDGRQSQAGMIYVNGTLFGTTREGGEHNKGTLFKLSI
jgi:uncharacterized repeat protein (TIGR03803 family)